jgi:hypothetical protein
MALLIRDTALDTALDAELAAALLLLSWLEREDKALDTEEIGEGATDERLLVSVSVLQGREKESAGNLNRGQGS